MKSLIAIKKICLVGCLTTFCQLSFGQLNQTNPDQYVIISVSNKNINGSVSTQTKDLKEIAILQGTISGEFTAIKTWEKKYNSYLKTARGYTETMKAGTMLYIDGMRIIRSLIEVKNAADANTQGIIATAFMNNLYMETATEFIRTYRLLQTTVAKGGKDNMLNGAERNEMLWSLVEQMEALNKKLHTLAISIAYYNLTDVWRMATAGLVRKNHDVIAREAFDRWTRARRVIGIINN